MNPNTPPAITATRTTAAPHRFGLFSRSRCLSEGLGGASAVSASASLEASLAASDSVSSTFSSSPTVEVLISVLSFLVRLLGWLVPFGDVELNPHAAGVVEGRFPEVEPVPGVDLDVV